MSSVLGNREPLESLGASLEFAGPVRWECFRDGGIREILEALSLSAPLDLEGGVVVITSTYREPGSGFSWHSRFAALDYRTGLYRDQAGNLALGDRRGSIVAATPELALEIAQAWADRLSNRLGSNFDVVFGDARHINHGHVENDAAKRKATQ